MAEEKTILVVDDDQIILDSLCEFLSLEGLQPTGAKTLKDALAQLQSQSYCLVITDINLPDGDGFELLEAVRKNHPQTVVIAITGYGSIESAVRAIKLGAYDYLTKPIVDDELRLTIERAIKQQSIMSENQRLRLRLEQKYSLINIISHDYKMAKIFELVEAVADSNTTILMTGPSGTGKSILDPVGSNKTETVDTRILLASNKDLNQEVKQGRFREDLYYRINVVTIDLPALQERTGDIKLLAKHFLEIYCAQHNKTRLGITDEALEYLERYSWPGNVRELENAIERAVLLSKDKYIGPDDLPNSIKQAQNQQQEGYRPMGLKEALVEPEKNLIRHALETNNWNRQETAKALQINRTTLFKKMKQYGLYDEARRLGLT